MVHVTFIHGIANKPSAEVLLEQWRVALLDNDGVDLDAMGVSASMVYWADLLYAEPLLENVHTGPAPRWDERPVTRFERRGRDAGREITDLTYRRV